MDRTACVEIAALPLQLLLRRRPEWRDGPVAVVDRDKPQGTLLWVNARARRSRVESGMRYAAALSLERRLHAGVVPAGEIDAAVTALTRRLWNFSPAVEAAADVPGRFWLDASGLARLAPSLQDWAEALHAALAADGFAATLAVGFTRFGCTVGARTARTIQVFVDAEEERGALRRAPLARLDLPVRLRELLRKLGIRTLGAFADLPPEGIRRRFGADAQELHALARGELSPGLRPAPWHDPARAVFVFELPEENALRLLDCMETGLRQLLETLDARGEALAELDLRMLLEDGSHVDERLTPAIPAREPRPVQELLRLRLEAHPPACGVLELRLRGHGAPAAARQATLFQASGRDPDGARRAFARLRAEFGNATVVRTRLLDGHLPEARWDWEILEGPTAEAAVAAIARPRDRGRLPLVRRVEPRPRPVAAPWSGAWYPAGLDDGPVEELLGPQILSGGWWVRETTRAYHWARTRNGRWLWVYHDRARDRWFLHGELS